jgi:uncharacterized protein YgfB (UPF0149 family)
MMNLIDRQTQLEACLSLANVEITASEVHGIMLGSITNHLKSGQTPDLLKLVEPAVASHDGGQFANLNDVLNEFYRECSETLLEVKEGFSLLLADENETLGVRTESLASWCKGYLLGLLYNQAFSIDQLPDSGAEIARDLMEISEAAVGDASEREEDWALAELEEYVKVGVQLIFEFIYTERVSDAPTTTQ